MSSYITLQHELKNKERSISDLIRFIETRTDNNPNYSLLLGAGCSITSGIRSANQLIKLWKKEIFIHDKGIEEIDFVEKDCEDYFTSQVWFDSRNAYSSLFEKRYDLARQRRMFIEQEVRDKLPSIGYSYLIKLVEKNFFKTLFTTNFDDLLNEAFYQYSIERPILCAHDSAVSSITTTSRRPKIIKLHGDYLFDDIKSTLRETESLEENIKNKFIEFSKDYGLIVLGYGGNDRSIIDILNYLLKNDDYFKHGIYWCLREDSLINEDVRKLLWKDRVYYIKISGFDELMAEIHSNLNPAILPIDSSYLDERKNEIISKLISNPWLKNSDNEFIKKDFLKLKKTRAKDVFSNFLKFLEEKDDDSESSNSSEFKLKETEKTVLSDDERKLRITLRQELFTSNYDHVLNLVNDTLLSTNKSRSFYKELLEIKAQSLRKLNEKEQAINCYQELISLDSKDIEYYLQLSRLVKEPKKKIEWIDKAIEIDEFNDELYYEKSKLLLEIYDTSLGKSQAEVENIEKIVDRGIELYPTISNPIWNIKFELIDEKNLDANNKIKEYETLISKLEKQNKYSPIVVRKKIEYLVLKKEKDEKIIKYIEDAIDNNLSIKKIKSLELTFLNELCRQNNHQKIKGRLEFIENKYELDSTFLYKKAKIILEKFDDPKSAIEILSSISNKTKSVNIKLVEYLIYDSQLEKAKDINENYLDNDIENRIKILEAESKFEEALKLAEKHSLENPDNLYCCLTKSYLLLKNNLFDETVSYLTDKLKPSNFTQGYLLVNYYLAQKKKGGHLNEQKIKEKLINGFHSDKLIKAAGLALLDQDREVVSLLQQLVTSNYSEKYKIRDWIIFEDTLKRNSTLRKLLDTDKKFSQNGIHAMK